MRGISQLLELCDLALLARHRLLDVAQRVAQGVGVRLETVLGRDTSCLSFVLSYGRKSAIKFESRELDKLTLVLLGFGQHPLDLLLRQTALIVGDDDLVGLARRLIRGRR